MSSCITFNLAYINLNYRCLLSLSKFTGKAFCSNRSGTSAETDDSCSDSESEDGCVVQAVDPICSACTYENKPGADRCEICNTELKMQSKQSGGKQIQIAEACYGPSTILCQPHLNQLSIDLFLERLLLPIRDTIGADTSPAASLPSFMSAEAYVRFSQMDVSSLETRKIIDVISQQSTIESTWADREIVQEQQQEREEQKEVQVFQVVQPQGDRDPQRECSWQVANIHVPKILRTCFDLLRVFRSKISCTTVCFCKMEPCIACPNFAFLTAWIPFLSLKIF